MGVAEEEEVQVLLLRRQPRRQQGLLHTVGVAVAHQSPLVPQVHQLLRLSGAPEKVAVAVHLLKGQLREAVVEPFPVPPAVPKMDQHVHRLYHLQNPLKIPV